MNQAIFIGNLVRDPEARILPSGVNLTNFTVAVNGRKKDDQPLFVRVTTWRGLAENCQRYLAKGRKVAVVGSISLNTYTGNDGQQRASVEMNADEVEFLSPRSDADDSDFIGRTDKSSGMVVVDAPDGLPF